MPYFELCLTGNYSRINFFIHNPVNSITVLPWLRIRNVVDKDLCEHECHSFIAWVAVAMHNGREKASNATKLNVKQSHAWSHTPGKMQKKE